MGNNASKNIYKVGVGAGILYTVLSIIFLALIGVLSYFAWKNESVELTWSSAIVAVIFCLLILAIEFIRIGKCRKKADSAK